MKTRPIGDPERLQLSRFGQSCRIDPPQSGTRKLKLRRPRRYPPAPRPSFIRRSQNALHRDGQGSRYQWRHA